ncbi:MAG: hypothetical protein H0U69_01515 [Trueperaceae bacterium]|nr:hypothetical protein [Trueperaceae bacterium]
MSAITTRRTHLGAPWSAIARGLALVLVLAAIGSSVAADARTHAWATEGPAAPEPAPPFPIGPLDALDLAASVRGAPASGLVTLSLHARYRLDAPAYLDAKRADVADLDTLHTALRERDRRGAALDRFAARCESLWRAWQVRLLHDVVTEALANDPWRDAEGAYLAALRRMLARDAADVVNVADVDACRLEAWTVDLTLADDAPEARSASAEAGLAARGVALATAQAPPTLWFEADTTVGIHAAPSLSLRAGLELPFTGAGSGALALGVARSGPDVGLTWRPTSLDDRIVQRHGRSSAPRTERDDGERWQTERFDRRGDEAALMRADAHRRWLAACGADDAATIARCLEGATPSVRDELLGAIEAELGAVHARLAYIAASGHDLDVLLRRPGSGPPRPHSRTGASRRPTPTAVGCSSDRHRCRHQRSDGRAHGARGRCRRPRARSRRRTGRQAPE